ncbi:MAG: ABC transporter substrate-binding protein [Clostridia bacterium]|nr:ABC transporter substrate-binding protein [Clostridia bacterium]
MKRTLALLLALLTALSLCACAKTAVPPAAETTAAPAAETPAAEPVKPDESGATAPKEITVTDMIGREVTVVPGSYTNVVCIGAGALRMFCYIGDVADLCGVEDIDNTALSGRPKMFDSTARPYVLAFGDRFAELPSCGVGGPQAQTAEAEKILACDPDIVISEYEDVEKENALQEQLGVPVITLRSGPGGVFDDSFFGSLRLLGTIFGREERTEELIAFIGTERAEIAKRTADIPEADKPAVYICGLGNWGTTNHLMTAQNYIAFSVANLKNVVTDLSAPGIQPIEEEKFAALGEEMDVMFIDAAAVKNIKPLFAENPALFDTCKAWRNGEVYLEMAYNAYYTNYEIALINTWFMAKTVYPDRFADIDITAKTNEVTKMFLGRELADEIFAAPSSFGGYRKIDTETFFD